MMSKLQTLMPANLNGVTVYDSSKGVIYSRNSFSQFMMQSSLKYTCTCVYTGHRLGDTQFKSLENRSNSYNGVCVKDGQSISTDWCQDIINHILDQYSKVV